jgi:hypothetical protein
VSDIFHEVDEEVRREQLKKLWDRYGHLIVGAAVVFVLAVAAWRGYEWYEAKKAAEAGAAYDAAAQLAVQGKHAEAETAFAQVATRGAGGYRVLARLREAEVLAARDPKAAVAIYDAIAADSSAGQLLQQVAAIRAGLLLVDTAPLDEMSRRLEPLAEPTAPFRNTARELLAMAAWRVGDAAAVKRWSEAVLNDPEAPAGIRARVGVLQALASESGKS